MQDSASSTDGRSYAVICGAGSAGLVWEPALALLGGATLLPAPDELTVCAMAAAIVDTVAALPEPRVLAGSSLGAMVALEIARTVRVDALVLIAAGFGITVSDEVLERVAAGGPELFTRMARASLSARDDAALVDLVTRDFETRGHGVFLRHMRALGEHTPEPPAPPPPPTIVVWGEHDRSVPLADHAELALRCGGVLVPVRAAGHLPYLEQPREVVHWIRAAAELARP